MNTDNPRIRTVSSQEKITRIPYGFQNTSEFIRFGKTLYSGFGEAGYDDVTAFVQGSAAQGNFKEDSDLDIAIASPSLFDKAKQLGIKIRGKGNQPRILVKREGSSGCHRTT